MINDNDTFDINLIGIGVPKAATTWLNACLNEHPDVCLAEKEVNFFNAQAAFPNEKPQNYQKGLQWYKKQFQHCNKNSIIGEYSVDYFADEHAPKRIAEQFPDINFIIILRNPIDRAYSHYQYRKAKGRDFGASKRAQEKSFVEFLKTEKRFREVGFYDEHLKRWFSYFDKDQFFIITYDQVKKDPHRVIKESYNFLEVNSDFTPSTIRKKKNTTKQKQRLNFSNSLLSFFANTAYSILDFFNFSSKRGYPELSPKTSLKAYQLYKPHIEKTEEILGGNLSHWHPPTEEQGQRNDDEGWSDA